MDNHFYVAGESKPCIPYHGDPVAYLNTVIQDPQRFANLTGYLCAIVAIRHIDGMKPLTLQKLTENYIQWQERAEEKEVAYWLAKIQVPNIA